MTMPGNEGIITTFNGQQLTGTLTEVLGAAAFEPHKDLLTFLGGEAFAQEEVSGRLEVPEPPIRVRGDESEIRFRGLEIEPDQGFRIHERIPAHPAHPHKRIK